MFKACYNRLTIDKRCLCCHGMIILLLTIYLVYDYYLLDSSRFLQLVPLFGVFCYVGMTADKGRSDMVDIDVKRWISMECHKYQCQPLHWVHLLGQALLGTNLTHGLLLNLQDNNF